jgi:secernin
MCDSLVALKQTTADGVTLLAKNSDRIPNEGQHLQSVPAADHAPGSRVRCTYIEIPQVGHTHAVLLSKPYWMWGAEIGVNDHNVAIGNEAVFSKEPPERTGELLGMDLLRLGLERAATARQALTVIIELLERHGQGGNCLASGKLYYHNSFLIADPNDAWVLETVGRRYAAKQVRDIHTISNCLSLESELDLASPDLAQYAVQKGWARSVRDFKFAQAYADFLYTTFGRGRQRRAATDRILRSRQGRITVQTMIDTLRNHTPDGAFTWEPQSGFFTEDVCMHVGFGPIRDSQCTSSMVVHLDPQHPTIFVTGTSAPCTSIFKPVWLDAALPDTGPVPADTYNPASLYWQHERLHRTTIRNYEARFATYHADRDALEAGFVEGGLKQARAGSRERAEFAAECFSRAAAMESEWLQRVERVPARPHMAWLYEWAWSEINRQARMPKIS